MINLSRQLMRAVGDVVDLADETLMDAVTLCLAQAQPMCFCWLK